MRQAAWIVVLLVATSIASEPLLHTHHLTHPAADVHARLGKDLPCAICATAAALSIPPAPLLAPPVAFSWSLFVAPLTKVMRLAHGELAARAPPAA